eukprot:Sdes_comp20799_c0_seq6m17094
MAEIQKEKSSLGWKPFFFGGVSSMTAEFLTFPIDTSKTRLQIQGQVIQGQTATLSSSPLKYRGMLHTIFCIMEEGFFSLFYGVTPALIRQASYGTLKIGIYHSLKTKFQKHTNEEPSLFENVSFGLFAGIISSTIANPTDVLKVRMQAGSSNSSQSSMLTYLKEAYRHDGLKGLWRGVGPNAGRAAIVTSVELPAYDSFKHFLIANTFLVDSAPTHFLASFGAGFCGALASNPIDVAKTRLMNQFSTSKTAAEVTYKNTFDCLSQTVRNEGVFALYKGFVPNWVRLGPWNIFVSQDFEFF